MLRPIAKRLIKIRESFGGTDQLIEVTVSVNLERDTYVVTAKGRNCDVIRIEHLPLKEE